MKIIDVLKERSETPSDEVKIELKLYNLVDDLEKKARNHLKRITNILPEFDIHDEKHSEKIIQNIENLLGSDQIKNASTYELVLMYLSAFFHDCAMAPSDWEINVMKLTEGTDKFNLDKNSIKNDLKKPLKISEALTIITERKKDIYGEFKNDIKLWLFSPSTEEKLIQYLAELLVEYQNYRNGFAYKLKSITSNDEFSSLNNAVL